MIWKRTRVSHQQRQELQKLSVKHNDLEILELAAAAGEIDLLYGDESGCCLWSAASYSYYFLGEQKRQEQTKKRGKRLSILGLWQPLVIFVYSLVLGSWKSEDFIKLMNSQAQIAADIYQRTGRIRVMTLDNGSIHTSKKVKKKLCSWEAQGLYLFFLPPYCSLRNPIELEWEHLKRDELVGQMFESESELADELTVGFEARGERNGHQVEYVNLRSRSGR